MKMSPSDQVERHIPLPQQFIQVVFSMWEILIVLLACYQCNMALKSDIRAYV